MALDPDIAALMHRFGVDGPPPVPLPGVAERRAGRRELARALAPYPPLPVGSVADDTLAGVGVRIYRPRSAGPAPAVVYCHGGGFVVGDLDTHDAVCRRLCRDVAAVVVAVGYRLAPEHPYPAAYEDCLAVARDVAGHPERFGGGSGVFALAGDGAGATLAAAVAPALRDAGTPVAALLLAYPVTDLTGRGGYPSMEENATGYGTTTAAIENDILLYVGNDPGTAADGRASPLLAESHRGPAPAVIGVGHFDPLRDQVLAYARALEEAGVAVRPHLYPGLVHGFMDYAALAPAADAAVTELFGELRALVRPPAPAATAAPR
ncbi:acetylhydrolase [Streptomyces cirratus]|uniref:Acetylhydrolase n=1 Tax=Streptomyces cirratus TaxID=68187 RepID=A0ABQ3EVK6_9ACTN|nr:alpha/beta hydrolase [Streptomyces cirratus]GHB66305.1 acetylhydrolase [Streptomyces cirratus]